MSQFRLLVRTFFERFFDNELVSSAIELRQALISLLVLVTLPPAFIAMDSMGAYMFVIRRTPWLLERFSWPHKLFFITYSILVIGAATVVVWDSLTLDHRDAMVLGALPLRGRTIVSAKFAALLLFLLSIAIGVNGCASVAYSFDASNETTYRILVRGRDARARGLRTIDDAAREAPRWQAAFSRDLLRGDGYAGLAAVYHLQFLNPPRALDFPTSYEALADGRVDLIDGDPTIRLTRTLDLVPLADNREYFSPYGSGVGTLIRLMAVHLVTTVAASAWVFTTLIALQAMLTILPRRVRTVVTLAFQAAFVVLLFSMLALMPTALRAIANALQSTNAGAARMVWLLPPAWFLGLYETLAGSSRALMHQLARGAAGALAMSVTAAVLVSAAAYLHQLRYAVEAAVTPSAASSLLARARALVLRAAARTPDTRAALGFTLISLARSRKHQLLVAAYAGAGLALVMVILVRAAARGGIASLGHPRVAVLWVPLVMILWLLVGVRAAFRMPTELAASWTFHVNASGPARAYAPAARAAAALTVLAPVLAISLIVYMWLFGWRLAAIHVAFCGLMGAALLEVLFARFDQIPFTRAYEAGRANVRVWWPLYIFGLDAFAHWPVYLEQWMLRDPGRSINVLLAMTAVVLVLRWACRRSISKTSALVFDVTAEPALITLELSG